MSSKKLIRNKKQVGDEKVVEEHEEAINQKEILNIWKMLTLVGIREIKISDFLKEQYT